MKTSIILLFLNIYGVFSYSCFCLRDGNGRDMKLTKSVCNGWGLKTNDHACWGIASDHGPLTDQLLNKFKENCKAENKLHGTKDLSGWGICDKN